MTRKLFAAQAVLVAMCAAVITPGTANAAKITVSLSGQGKSLVCSSGYAQKGMSCPSIAAPPPAACPPDWVAVPSMVIPADYSNRTITVPAFCVMKYAASQSGSAAVSSVDGMPWTNITWYAAQSACAADGGHILRESEWMAIAHNLTNVGANWSGGFVDSGDIKGGLQNNADATPHPASGMFADGRIRTLSTGEAIWDIGGNIWHWTYHDLVGGSSGIWGAMPFSQRTAPFDSGSRGMGWYPSLADDYQDGFTLWSGFAPVRGGRANSFNDAGPFNLSGANPSYSHVSWGFRCAK